MSTRSHRRRAALRASALIVLAVAACTGRTGFRPSPTTLVTEYRNGRWFDGNGFVARSMYVADGVFHERRPTRVDSVVDLAGGFVVPPFGDAHQHIYDPSGISSFIAAFLRDGIYYVKD